MFGPTNVRATKILSDVLPLCTYGDLNPVLQPPFHTLGRHLAFESEASARQFPVARLTVSACRGRHILELEFRVSNYGCRREFHVQIASLRSSSDSAVEFVENG